MKNLEVFAKNPHEHSLLNQGVAKVTGGRSPAELETLRYELKNFVCDGHYSAGLTRILSTYLSHLDKSEQPGVWVSGFFGSGKSHMVKMLQHLWVDTVLPDGSRARSIAELSQPVKDALAELATAARQLGGLHAVAGTLGAAGNVTLRLELLGLVYSSANLPINHARASFVLWLRDEKLEESVRRFISASGGDFDKEVANMYVSDHLAKSILAARPTFANQTADVRLLLKNQFPPVNDVSIEELIVAVNRALAPAGKLPCTLIALDEVQLYIGGDASRSKALQDLQEQCCSRLGSKLLFVGTGQEALSGDTLLQRLQGRFPVTIHLQDTDVEQVTREVVLKKKPSAEPSLRKLLEAHSGEIERHLANTKIAFTTEDRALLVQDYPILPVRRRFWERILRAVDTAGTTAQLRNQLWVVYDAVRKTADLPVGHVVSAAHIYDSSVHGAMLKSGVLLQEITERIAEQRKKEDGDLRYEICALIFLIGQVAQQTGPADIGIRADADTLADLLVTDLTKSSAELRKKVPQLLEKLVADGAVMKVETEYRMQTREGADWNQHYVSAKNRMVNDVGKLAGDRAQLLMSACSDALNRLRLTHGASKTDRGIKLHFGDNKPQSDGADIPVWVRDEWEVEESAVLNEARVAGESAGLVFGFVPKKNMAEELKQAIASYYAATTTLQVKGVPSTDEGKEARRAMLTRQEQAKQSRESLVTDILNGASVYVAGGDQINGTLLVDKIQEAAKACFDRLYPQFHLADYPVADWKKVGEYANKGAGDPLARVGYHGDAVAHPVCKALVDFVGSGKKGTEVRKHFMGARFGWPQDAVDACLIVLLQAGVIHARSGSEPIAKGKLDQKNIAAAEFRTESITLSTPQLIGVRTLFKAAGLNTQPGQESTHAVDYLNRLISLASAAGGEPPLPKVPDTNHISDNLQRVGNDQLKTIFEGKERLGKEFDEWHQRGQGIKQRQPRWLQLKALLNCAEDLPVAVEVGTEVDAIEQNRGLLAEPDPVPGLAERVTSALRSALNDASNKLKAEHEVRLSALETSDTWKQLTPAQRYSLLNENGIRELPAIGVGTAEEVLATLRQTKLSELHARCDALPTRFSNALSAAAKLQEPKAQTVHLPSAMISTEAELRSWLAEVEELLKERLKAGPVIL